jgi:NADH-quinone oxidoreductase subunit N
MNNENKLDPDLTLTLILVSPELICLLILVTTLINILLYKNHQDNIKITKLEIIGIIIRLISVLATLFVLTLYNAEFVLFNNQYAINNKLLFIKMFTVVVIIIVLFILHDNIENDPNLSIELLVMCLISLIGMFIMISANDLLILAIGLELQTIPYFIFCCLKRSSNISVEAGLKYFIYACFCSAILLFGISLIFGLLGTINFIELQNILDINNKNLPLNALLFSLSCVLVGLLFKLGVFPFHS